jgi:hypothetical protein
MAERLANTAEHLALAEQLGDPRLRWYALATRLQPCMEAGDIDAVDRCLGELGALTADLGQPHLAWAATLDRTWRVLLAGDVAAAEALAQAAFDVGSASGQRDAFMYFAAQLLAIRWTQGRLGELVPMLEQTAADNTGVPAFRALLALAYVEDDRPEAAHALLVEAAAGRFAELPVDMTWTSGITAWADVAARLEARGAAEVLYELLAPWASLVVFNGIYVMGSVARSVAGLAATIGDARAAALHFADACAVHERLAAPALRARTELEWGIWLGRCQEPERSAALLAAARDGAERLGLAGLVRRAERALAS